MYLSKKQGWHIEPPVGLLNDPNGLIWYRGNYYIFFQWNRFAKDHSNKAWGWCISPDLVHWQFRDSALVPDRPYDAQGVYSGSAAEIDGELCLYYTGNVKQNGRRITRQCLAVSEDGFHFQKQGPVLETPEGYTSHFRDPKVVPASGGGYWMVLGAQRTNGLGAVVRFSSPDGRSWSDCRTIGVSQEYQMIECPDLFSVEGMDVLLYCPQHRDNDIDDVLDSFSVYRMADLNKHHWPEDLDTGWHRMDEGFDFYSPQTFLTPDGRRVLLAWMSRMEGEEERAFCENEPRIHCLTMPRELFRRGDRVCQRPVQELMELPCTPVAAEMRDEEQFYHPSQRAFRFEMQSQEPCGDICLTLHDGELVFRYHAAAHQAELHRRRWTDTGEDIRRIQLEELRSLQLWCDQSSAELFLNGGEVVLSARIYPMAEQPSLHVVGVPSDVPAWLALLPVNTLHVLKNEEETS